MEQRLIDANALRNEVLYDNTYDNDTVNYYLGIIDDAPTVEPVQSEWIAECDPTHRANGWYFCTHCREEEYFDGKIYTYEYCPNCGAKMNSSHTSPPSSTQEGEV